jgi:DNA polymerase
MSMVRARFPNESVSLDNVAKLLNLGAKGKELAQFAGKWELTPQEQQIMGGYCCNDVDLTAAAFDAMKKYFPVSELRLIDLTIRMFTEPVIVIDQPVVQEEYRREVEAKKILIQASGATKKELASGKKFPQMLMSLGVDPPKKLSPSKVKDGRVDPDKAGEPPSGILPDLSIGSMPKEQRAVPKLVAEMKEQKRVYPWAYAFGKTDELFTQLLEHPNEQVQKLAEARLAVKSTIKETRSKRFFEIGSRGAFPVYLNYHAAKTSRWGGGDKQNAQNMTRVYAKDPTSGALRKSWTAPEGHLFAVRDSGQIEARKLAYMANQKDALQMFIEGGDPYDRLATSIFGYEVDRKLPKFQLEGMVGKAGELGCGFGQGWAGFQENLRKGFMGAPPVVFTQENALAMGATLDGFCYQKSYKEGFNTLRDQALSLKPLNKTPEQHLWHCAATKAIVDGYRTDKSEVVALWKEAGNALTAILTGQEIPVGHNGMVTTYKGGLKLPGGIRIQYPQVTRGKDGFKYCSNVQRHEWSKLYGALVVENCIAEGTLVLTDSGYKPIETITLLDKIHDGVDFIAHGGIVVKGIQSCTTVDGVHMTPDHEVLTHEGWKLASSNPKPHRPDLRSADCHSPSAFGWEEKVLGVPVRVRGASSEDRNRSKEVRKERRNTKLWVPIQDTERATKEDTRNVEAPGICSMEVYERQVPVTYASGMEKLRGSGNSCLRAVAASIREFLGGYEGRISEGAHAGASEQRGRVLPGELRVGISKSAEQQPQVELVHTDPSGEDDDLPGSRALQDREVDTALSAVTKLAGGKVIHQGRSSKQSRVYDIINCGTRRRFVVLGDSGPFIVHNCVQGLSRIVVADQMLRVAAHLSRWAQDDPGMIYKVVHMLHDEIVCIVPEYAVKRTMDMMEIEMATPPTWCPDLPLKSSGEYAKNYGDCEH